MSKFKGTKGKWIVKSLDDTFIRSEENDCNIATLDGANFVYNEIKANALLISKAPELLEMLNTINECRTDFDRWGEIEQLIKEATELTIKEVNNEQ